MRLRILFKKAINLLIFLGLGIHSSVLDAQLHYPGNNTANSPYLSDQPNCLRELFQQVNVQISEAYEESAAIFLVLSPTETLDSARYHSHLAFTSNKDEQLHFIDSLLPNLLPITTKGCSVKSHQPFIIPVAIMNAKYDYWGGVNSTTDFYHVPQARKLYYLLKQISPELLKPTYWHLRGGVN